MGDVLWTEPVIRKLAEEYYRVVMLTPHHELFQNYPLKNVRFREERTKFDNYFLDKFSPRRLKKSSLIVLDMAYETRPKMHVLKAYFAEAGYLNEPLSYPRIYLSESERIAPHPNPYALIHIDPGAISRNYRGAHGIGWQMVVDHIRQQGLEPIFISDNDLGSKYGAKTITPYLRELISYINGCTLFVGLDSGPSQIAGALGKKAIIFFGSVNPCFRQLKDSFKGIILQKPCEFAGCYHEIVDVSGQICRLVGAEGIPKCCHFSTTEVLEAVDACLSDKNLH